MDDLESEIGIQEIRKKLKRDLRAEAMTRLEEAARTEADFENVVKCWDRLDENRERKERYHEPIMGDMTLENGLKYNGRIFPEWMCSANYTSVRQGRYLDVIFNCPFEQNEMTGHPVLSKAFQELDVEYKSLIFFLIVRNWTPQFYAAAVKQMDRNVRKKMARLVNRIQKKLYTELTGKSNLSLREKEFLAEYEKAALVGGEKERCAI